MKKRDCSSSKGYRPFPEVDVMKHRLLLLLIVIMTVLAGRQTQAERPEILIIRVADPIGPAVAEFVADGLHQAADSAAAAVIITLDTPGGLTTSMRQIVQAISTCRVPVIVYVSPAGARAASAGTMITMAADIAAMAPGTNIGAAHPVGAGGLDIAKTMQEKIVNDLAAFAEGIAQRQGRNAAWAEKAVRESVSVPAEEALRLNVIDLVAVNLDDLIAQIDGRTIKGKGTLHLQGAQRRELRQGLRIRILKTISDPNIAYILLMVGLAGLFLEFSHPGVVLPGVTGGIALVLAFFAMQTLPVNTAGILLILLAVIFFVLELKVTSYGTLSAAGILSLVLGSTMLFRGAGPQFRVAWSVLIPTVLLVSAFFIGVTFLVVRAQIRRPRTGAEGLVGEIGIVKQAGGREGKVMVHGETWRAVFAGEVSVGDRVCVLAVRDLVITAEPVKDDI